MKHKLLAAIKKRKYYPNGGYVDNDSENSPDTAPAAAPQTTTGSPPAPPPVAPGDEDTITADKPDAQGTSDVPVNPRSNPVVVTGTQPPTTAVGMDQEDAAHAQDLSSGAIKPKTYSDLMGNNGTLGRIGAIFGLMMSGAGSGLAHQPNMMLQMMDNEIGRDVDAQKTNQANRMDFLKLAQQHLFQQGQIGQMAAQTAATTAGTAQMLPAQVAQTQAATASQQAAADLTKQQIVELRAKNLMTTSIAHGYIADQVKKTPTPAAAATLQQVQQGAAAENQQRNIQAEKLYSTIQPQPTAPVNIQGMDQAVNAGKAAGVVGMPTPPGAMNAGEESSARQEANTVTANRAAAAATDESFRKLASMHLAGKLNPAMRDAEVTSLATKLQSAGMNPQAAQAQAEATLPNLLDTKHTLPEKYNRTMDNFRTNEMSTPTLDRFNLKTPFPTYRAPVKKKEHK